MIGLRRVEETSLSDGSERSLSDGSETSRVIGLRQVEETSLSDGSETSRVTGLRGAGKHKKSHSGCVKAVFLI